MPSEDEDEHQSSIPSQTSSNTNKRQIRNETLSEDEDELQDTSQNISNTNKPSSTTTSSTTTSSHNTTPSRNTTPKKRERTNPGLAIASAIDQLADIAKAPPPTSPSIHRDAILALYKEYSNILNSTDMAKAYSVMKSEVNATIFCAMPAGEARDIWLKEEINNINKDTSGQLQ
jgi:hypothetical protein